LLQRSRRIVRITLFTAALLAVVVPSLAVMRVSPGLVELKFENGRASGSFTLSNTDLAEIRVRATPYHFRLTPDGQIQNVPIDGSSLAPWIKITPREFTLGAASERQVRFSVIAPDTIKDGTYWGGVEFLPLPSHSDSEAAKFSVRAIAAILAPIMVDNGKPTFKWSLDSDSMRSVVTPRGVILLAPVYNTGTGRIPQKGHWEIRDLSGGKIREGDTQRESVFPHSMRLFGTMVPPDVPAGTYDYAVTYTSERDGSTLKGYLRFTVPDKLPDPPSPKKK
jgi:hypothetical protein